MQEAKNLTHRTHPSNGETYYDLWEDWELIESSFLKQYGIRIRADDDMSYAEFCSLLSGIMSDTPLGRIVSIRAEKDLNTVKNFTDEQKRIRDKWLLKTAEKRAQNPQPYLDYWSKMQQAFKAAFSEE